MEVEVKHLLPSRLPDMEEELVPREALLLRKLLCLEDEETRKMRRLRRDIGERSHKVFWDKEKVCPGFGSNISKGKDLCILKDNICRNLPVPNPMKDRSFFHER